MKRFFAWGAAVAAALLGLAFAFTYPSVYRLTNVGAGYVALQMCSCVEVSGRGYDACRLDMRPDMDRIRSEPVHDGERSGVRAWFPLYAERTAWHHPPDGCTLE